MVGVRIEVTAMAQPDGISDWTGKNFGRQGMQMQANPPRQRTGRVKIIVGGLSDVR